MIYYKHSLTILGVFMVAPGGSLAFTGLALVARCAYTYVVSLVTRKAFNVFDKPMVMRNMFVGPKAGGLDVVPGYGSV